MGLDYTLDCFIYGSGCLLLSEACMAASLLKHVEILDATGHNSVFRQIIHLFCFNTTQNNRAFSQVGYFLHYSIGKIQTVQVRQSHPYLPT